MRNFNVELIGELKEFCVAMGDSGWVAMRGYKITVDNYQFCIIPVANDDSSNDIALMIVELTSGGLIEEVQLPSSVYDYEELVDFIGNVIARKLVHFVLSINGENPNATNLDEQIEEFCIAHIDAYGEKPFTERPIEESLMN